MIKHDYHMHTSFSVDSDAPMEDVIKKAISLGLKEIALTDHCDYIFPNEFYPYQIDYDDYLMVFKTLKEKYKKDINIMFGIEIGIGPHLESTVSDFVKKYDFDFIIGSVHDIKGKELYLGNAFDSLDKTENYNCYFQYVLDSIKNIKDLCVLGHLDYISRYGNFPDPSVKFDDFADIIDQILIELITHEKGIEINTSGYRYGINDAYPGLPILKRYKELGGEIITIGSDAHKPQDIANNFDKTYDLLKQANFNYITTFKKRIPKFVKI